MKSLEKFFNPPFYVKFWRRIVRFFENARALFQWLPIIWENYEWDYSYLLEIMIFKLQRMADYHSTAEMVASSPVTSKQIQEVVRLLRRIKADDYRDEIENEYNYQEKYGERIMSIDENRRIIFFNLKGGEKLPPELQKEAKKIDTKIFWESEKRREKEMKKAMYIIAKAYRGWWE